MFKKLEFSDRQIIKKYYDDTERRNNECCFSNSFLWSKLFPVSYDIIEDMLILKVNIPQPSFCYPLGTGDIKRVIEALLDICEQSSIPFRMHGVTPLEFEHINSLFPDKFNFTLTRDFFDYIYLSESLATLRGKKLSSKRNHINRFVENNPDWSYEAITKENIDDCKVMLSEWTSLKNDKDRASEAQIAQNALEYFFELELSGGLIRTGGRAVAFTIGEQLCSDTFIVHFEKAFPDIQGAYQIINREFVRAVGTRYRYINREDDAGNENLRKAKLSYRPEILLEKGYITLK